MKGTDIGRLFGFLFISFNSKCLSWINLKFADWTEILMNVHIFLTRAGCRWWTRSQMSVNWPTELPISVLLAPVSSASGVGVLHLWHCLTLICFMFNNLYTALPACVWTDSINFDFNFAFSFAVKRISSMTTTWCHSPCLSWACCTRREVTSPRPSPW